MVSQRGSIGRGRTRTTCGTLSPFSGPPSIGHVDGTSAILSNRGFIFFFNPNGRRLSAEITLDDTIGLRRAARSH